MYSCVFTEICAPGFTGAADGPGCVVCAADTFKPAEGRDACTKCEEGTTTEGRTGSTKKNECLGKMASPYNQDLINSLLEEISYSQ